MSSSVYSAVSRPTESLTFAMGHSKDAIHWNFDENKINFVDEDGAFIYAGICV